MENRIDGGKNARSLSHVLFAKFDTYLRSEETARNPMHPAMFQ